MTVYLQAIATKAKQDAARADDLRAIIDALDGDKLTASDISIEIRLPTWVKYVVSTEIEEEIASKIRIITSNVLEKARNELAWIEEYYLPLVEAHTKEKAND